MTAPHLIGEQLRHVGHSVLNCVNSRSSSKHKRLIAVARFGVATALVAVPMLAIGSLYIAGTKTDFQVTPKLERTVVSVRMPDLRNQMEAIESTNEVVNNEVFVRPDETLVSLFARLGINDRDALDFIIQSPEAMPLLYPKQNQLVSASVHEGGRLLKLHMYIDEGVNAKLLEIQRTTGFACTLKPFKYDVQLNMANGTISGSVSETLQRNNIPASVVAQMHSAFEADRDVVSQLTTGDAFRVIYEAKYAQGSFVRNGRLLAMQLVRKGRLTELFWFGDDDQGGGYYDAKGQTSKRTFLRVPLDVKSVSSEFAALRRHPVTGVLRPHQGTDFRAPWGAVVRAAADGKVVFAGIGNGYGKYIKVQHGPDCMTLYAHLSSIDKTVRIGSTVQHGQEIGRVGQTGLATGPHLHYELKIDGIQINPMTAKLPDAKVLSPYKFAQMQLATAKLREKLLILEKTQVADSKR